MVLTGKISTGEASNLRRLVMDHKVGIADFFTDIMQKKDVALLAELRQFSDKRKKYDCLPKKLRHTIVPVVSDLVLLKYAVFLRVKINQ